MNHRPGRPGGRQRESGREDGRVAWRAAFLTAEATLLCQPASCCEKECTALRVISQSSVGFSCQYLNLISLEMFLKLASIIMTQNSVLNYHDCFWGPGIINIYYILIVWDYFDTFLWYVRNILLLINLNLFSCNKLFKETEWARAYHVWGLSHGLYFLWGRKNLPRVKLFDVIKIILFKHFTKWLLNPTLLKTVSLACAAFVYTTSPPHWSQFACHSYCKGATGPVSTRTADTTGTGGTGCPVPAGSPIPGCDLFRPHSEVFLIHPSIHPSIHPPTHPSILWC